MIMTGNVQVCDHVRNADTQVCYAQLKTHCQHISTGRDIVIPRKITANTIGPFERLADSMHQDGDESGPLGANKPLAIMQLSHGGRQSNALLGGRLPWEQPLAPSGVTVGGKGSTIQGFWHQLFYKSMFSTPKEMSIKDIDDVVSQFVHGAKVAFESGFDGVQLHAAHGCE
jgi:2,4-dienoyl-CoA reductase-like NADH-dependent reductase (Old Yellow Enzyme family)